MKLSFSNLTHLLSEIEPRCAHDTLVFYTPSADVAIFFGDLCAKYLESAEAGRIKLRETVRCFKGVQNNLVAFAYECTKEIQRCRRVEWLRSGLAAAALACSFMDERDMLLLYAELFVSAEESGLDPRNDFEKLCLLEDFEHYAVVASRRAHKPGSA